MYLVALLLALGMVGFTTSTLTMKKGKLKLSKPYLDRQCGPRNAVVLK